VAAEFQERLVRFEPLAAEELEDRYGFPVEKNG
jgi:hypothetical protein